MQCGCGYIRLSALLKQHELTLNVDISPRRGSIAFASGVILRSLNDYRVKLVAADRPFADFGLNIRRFTGERFAEKQRGIAQTLVGNLGQFVRRHMTDTKR
jgi:hypothetical protein